MQIKKSLGLSTVYLSMLAACVALTGELSAGVIRHDVSHSEYIALGLEPEYQAAGMIMDGGGTGSAVLIDPWWVMTAAHCIGTTPDYVKYFVLNGETVAWDPDERYLHPDEDIGIFKLSRPITDIEPAKLWTSDLGTELGRIGTIVGYGRSGDGLTGVVLPSRTRRAVCNVIDKLSSSGTRLLSDFDSPDGTNSSSGSNMALPLEGMGASGDSGAPVYAMGYDGETYVTAIHVGHWWSDGANDCDYGDGNIWVRVSPYVDWIDSIYTPTPPGDANLDGKVDGSDVTILAGNWQAGVPGGDPSVTWEMGDFNRDGKVDGSDVTILAGNWQAGTTTVAAAVPEPSCIALLAGLVGFSLVWRRNRFE